MYHFHYLVIFFIRVDGRGPSFEKCKKMNHLIQECFVSRNLKKGPVILKVFMNVPVLLFIRNFLILEKAVAIYFMKSENSFTQN